MYKEHLYKFLEKSFENFYFFLENVILLRLALINMRPKNQKQTIFKPNLFGNIYTTLNFLSNGIQYMKLFSCINFSYFLRNYF